MAAPGHDLRVLVVADDHLARAGLAALIDDQPGCAVAGQVSGLDYASIGPDVFSHDVEVWDLGWVPERALEAFVGDTDEHAPPAVVLMADESSAAQAWAAGARGILARDVDGEILGSALSAVVRGLAVIGPEMTSALHPAAAEPLLIPSTELTPREIEVLGLVADGLPNKAIAQRLSISEHTVKFHVNAVMSKLGAQSRTEAVTRATRMGLISL